MNRRSRREPLVTILTVCTGNICRSPLAEQMLRLRFAGDPRFEIGSAGLHAVVGARMDNDAALQLRSHGGDPTGLQGEQISNGHVDVADLILTMTRSQRDDVIRRYPRAMQRTFTMAEFVALLDGIDNVHGDVRTALELIAHAARTRARVRLSKTDDIFDPIDSAVEVHKAVGNQIVALVDKIVPLLRDAT